VIRRGVDMAMRMMGEQFVTGETIDEALKRRRSLEAKGFRYSYDMLGEAATTAPTPSAIMPTTKRRSTPSARLRTAAASMKAPASRSSSRPCTRAMSAPRAARVMGELLPKVKALALIAKSYDIGLNIDAEEADRLELSLDLLENCASIRPLPAGTAWASSCRPTASAAPSCSTSSSISPAAPAAGSWCAWSRAPIGTPRSSAPRSTASMVSRSSPARSTPTFPTSPARKLLAATDAVFPQFATHNAQTLATIYQMAGPDFKVGKYEFQCLHGMGEPLYDEVVGKAESDRPCRIYAPVGTHETLLAYLVRRLLENGANSSFVNRIADPASRSTN
jgi:RHH-type proline utilization regulon transcriptional repressor/proline dehydrogenase/delta 1-pyrroline-5-carboxylate dehydrogenase